MTDRIDDLNHAVTEAILRAEDALDAARRAWLDVLQFEGALGTALDEARRHDLEYQVALRGAGRAALVVDILSTLRGLP